MEKTDNESFFDFVDREGRKYVGEPNKSMTKWTEKQLNGFAHFKDGAYKALGWVKDKNLDAVTESPVEREFVAARTKDDNKLVEGVLVGRKGPSLIVITIDGIHICKGKYDHIPLEILKTRHKKFAKALGVEK